MKKTVILLLLALLTLAACGGGSSSALPSSTPSSAPSSSQPTSSSAQDELTLDEVNRNYVRLLPITREISHSEWASPINIPASDLVYFCDDNNLLGFGHDDLPHECPAEAVEAAVQKYFDVPAEYLRTAREFDEKTMTYTMLPGGGGGWTRAMSYEREGDLLRIVVWSGWGGGPEDGYPTQLFLLTVRIEADGFKYLSYMSHSGE